MFCTRDYLSMKLWDIRNNSKHLKSIQINDYVEKKLCDLYENESVFDKFEVNASPCGNYLLTGSYNNNGHVIDIEGSKNGTIDAIFGNKRGKVAAKTREYKGKKLPSLGEGAPDLKKKCLLNAWHPFENIIAVANHNCIFVYNIEKQIKH
jgi:serine/threonine-protein phosphatase 2A regulatory subunit B